ncbi:S1 family serine peptidase [Streptomyces sp. NRRL S-646]|uniref:S1 family serine peptidase n=1 Tax=Streptomyces sp. NRRL S-646 TaxID=1463917 RepID=UPI0004C9756B|nr:serine protease [Streptomyces sp. NRRL S-646]
MLRKLVASAAAALGLAVASTSPAAAIVGGTPATTSVRSSVVSIQAQGLFGWSHVCGGVLIDANTVITAAHCVNGWSASQLKVGFGGLDRNRLPHSRLIISVHGHPRWNAETFADDVAVLKMAQPVSESATVHFARLATHDPEPGAQARVTGWGKTQEGSPTLPTALHTVQLPITTRATCQADYSGPNLNIGGDENNPLEGLTPVVGDGNLCAGYPQGGKGTCNGDSGDPLVVNGTVVGILSWSRGCAQANSPAVFSSVAHYRHFLTA